MSLIKIINEEIQSFLGEEIYHYYYPNHRGELTLDKIIRRIKGVSSFSTQSDLFTVITRLAYKEIKRFSSPEELMDNIYWHGSGGGVSKGLQAGFNFVKKGSEGGGGYGEQYHSISLSKSKNEASNFTGMSRFGMVYPVLLRKGATVEKMPNVEDANEIEDVLVDLWLRKIDAVKIGEWDNWASEQELVVLNPHALLKFQGEGYQIYQKKKFENPTIETYRAIFNTVQNITGMTKDDKIPVAYSNQATDAIDEEIQSFMNETTYKVYHGTNDKFGKFSLNRSTQGIIWFTDSIDSIKNSEHGGHGNKYIMTRYITINKPAGWNEYEKYGLGQLRDLGYDGVILPQGDKTDYFVFSNKSISAKPNGMNEEDFMIGDEDTNDASNDMLPSFGDHLFNI